MPPSSQLTVPSRVEQGPPHQPDDDGVEDHRDDEQAAHERRAVQVRVEERARAVPSTDWTTTPTPTMRRRGHAALGDTESDHSDR